MAACGLHVAVTQRIPVPQNPAPQSPPPTHPMPRPCPAQDLPRGGQAGVEVRADITPDYG
jgi:hypothetical protein